jgi:uncharacterized protein (TIGR02453 family)
MKEILKFLELLSGNNNREWFEANKPMYQSAKSLYETLITNTITGIGAFDSSIGHPLAKDCLFRIFRDVRFSKDKAPYKTNFGAFIASGGRKSPKSGYYIHIEPGKSFIGGGIYMPQPDVLKKLRQEVYFNAPELRAILSEKKFKSTFGTLGDWDKLKRPPKDFPADFEHIDLLMYKSYAVGHNLKDEEILEDSFPEKILEVCKTMKPLNDFLDRAAEA